MDQENVAGVERKPLQRGSRCRDFRFSSTASLGHNFLAVVDWWPLVKYPFLNSNSIWNLRVTGLLVYRLLSVTLIKQTKTIYSKFPNQQCCI